MKIVRCACVMVFLASSLGVSAQGAYLEKGENGFGAEVRTMWSPKAFKGVGFTTGYSIAGILDIGFDLGYTLGEISGNDSSELELGFTYNVNVMKQSQSVPLSLQITGSYGLANVSSDFLETSFLERRAIGYSIGLSLSRNFRLTSHWLLRLNTLVDYRSFLYTDTDMSADPPDIDDQERIADLFFGGGLGFLFVFSKGQTLAIRAEVRANEELQLQIHPVLAVAFPQN